MTASRLHHWSQLLVLTYTYDLTTDDAASRIHLAVAVEQFRAAQIQAEFENGEESNG